MLARWARGGSPQRSCRVTEDHSQIPRRSQRHVSTIFSVCTYEVSRDRCVLAAFGLRASKSARKKAAGARILLGARAGVECASGDFRSKYGLARECRSRVSAANLAHWALADCARATAEFKDRVMVGVPTTSRDTGLRRDIFVERRTAVDSAPDGFGEDCGQLESDAVFLPPKLYCVTVDQLLLHCVLYWIIVALFSSALRLASSCTGECGAGGLKRGGGSRRMRGACDFLRHPTGAPRES